MQAMNAGVRNWVFAPAFFGTSVLLMFTALAALRAGERRAATGFALAAGLLHALGAMVPTMTVNVPVNGALALVETPLGAVEAGCAWRTYSGPRQVWNAVRAAAAGFVLALAGWSLRGADAFPVRRAGG